MFRIVVSRLPILIVFLLVLALVPVVPIAHAAGASIVVNKLADADDGTDGGCSLREAILAANGNADHNECTGTGYGADTITFSVSGTISLGSKLPVINDDVTIDGTGQSITVDGGGTYQIMGINLGKTVYLTDLTFANGLANGVSTSGGAINNSGTLTITGSTFTGNHAINGGAIHTGGMLTINNSTFTGNGAQFGGAVLNAAPEVDITDSTFTSNQTTCNTTNCKSQGGALYTQTTLHVTGSTLSGNSATCTGTTCLANGGGIFNNAALSVTDSEFDSNTTTANGSAATGGGIYSASGSILATVTGSTFYSNSAADGGGIMTTGKMNVTNSTFSANTAVEGGGIDNEFSILNVANSTFSGNSASAHGGGIFVVDTTTVKNSIFANHPSGGDCYKFSGTMTVDSTNLADDSSCDSATQVTISDLRLGTITNYGGPTKTIALTTGSVAIDAGDDTTCSDIATVDSIDQRGVVRPQGTHCDVGAYEAAFISGEKFNDLNGNGIKDAGEPGLVDWSIDLNDTSDNNLQDTVTDVNGNYSFIAPVIPFTYRVREVLQDGWKQTTANPGDLALVTVDASASNVNFGNFKKISISGEKFNDLNGNGTLNPGEPGLTGWTIQLEDTANNVISTTQTIANGAFVFSDLGPGTYRLREVPQTGWVQATANPADIVASSGSNVSNVLFGNAYEADMSIVKTFKILTNSNVTYTLKVTNLGPGTANKVVVTDTVPVNWGFVSVSATQGTCSNNAITRTVTCALGKMQANATATVTLKVAPLKSSNKFTNCADVSSKTLDPNPSNNESCVSKQ